MTLLVKMMKSLLAGARGPFAAGRPIAVYPAVPSPDSEMGSRMHVARDHVPLSHHLQIMLFAGSPIDGMIVSKVQSIWRFPWDSSPQLSPSRSAC